MKLKQASALKNLQHSHDAISVASSRHILHANDSIDWSQLGRSMTPVSNPFSITSAEGIDVTFSLPTGSFLRIDQTPSFPGAFNVGDSLLFTGLGNPGPLVAIFDMPIFGVGLHIQSDPREVPDYIASIEAFDDLNMSLGRFEFSGISLREANSGTVLAGVLDQSCRIKKLAIATHERGVSVPFAISTVILISSMRIYESA
jgi:hypothetical protein